MELRRAKASIDALTGALHRTHARVHAYRFPIATKLALVFTALITSGMLVLGAMITRNQSLLLEQQLTDFGQTIAQQMGESAKEQLLAGDILALDVVTNNTVEHHRIRGAAIYNDEMALVTRVGLVPESGHLRNDTLRWQTAPREDALYSFLAPITFRDLTAGYSLVTLDSSLTDRAQAETVRAVAGATLILALIGIFASVFLGKRLTRPIYELMYASQAISKGDYTIRFEDRRNDELGALMDSMNTMTAGLLRKEQVEKTFSRYVSPNVAREILAHLEEVELGGRHVEASVVFADIAGFTAMSETMPPEAVSDLLNEYFTYIARAAEAYGGYVDKYIGDCAMLVFGIPRADPAHAFNALACAVLIQRLVAELNRGRAATGGKQVSFRIGVNCGMMLAGNMGAADRLEYTVVGDAVNLASRLGHAGEPGQVIITEEMCEDPRITQRVITAQLGRIKLRGKREPIAIYAVTDLQRDDQAELEKKFEQIIHGT